MSASQSAEPLRLERTYTGTPEELWALWTTREGFEAWWGPQGFRVEVRRIEPRDGGILEYAMIAAAPEMIAGMKAAGQPLSHETRGVFRGVVPFEALELHHTIDFVPGVPPHEHRMRVTFTPEGAQVRMVIEIGQYHTEALTQMATEGMTSQLTKVEEALKSLRAGS